VDCVALGLVAAWLLAVTCRGLAASYASWLCCVNDVSLGCCLLAAFQVHDRSNQIGHGDEDEHEYEYDLDQHRLIHSSLLAL